MTPGGSPAWEGRQDCASALTHPGSNLSPDAIWAFANNQLIVSGPNGTAGIFATYPSGHLDMVNGFFDQVHWGRVWEHREGDQAALGCLWAG